MAVDQPASESGPMRDLLLHYLTHAVPPAVPCPGREALRGIFSASS